MKEKTRTKWREGEKGEREKRERRERRERGRERREGVTDVDRESNRSCVRYGQRARDRTRRGTSDDA